MTTIMKCLTMLLWICTLPTSGMAETDTDGDWTREITIPQGIVVIYQPQPDVLEGNILKGRAAVAVELEGAKEAVKL